MADATTVQIRLCGLTRLLSYEAALAASRMLSVHTELVAKSAALEAAAESKPGITEPMPAAVADQGHSEPAAPQPAQTVGAAP